VTRDVVRDECRRQVAARGLTPVAAALLAGDALGRIELSRLAPLKALLKQFFSDEAWTTEDDRALAVVVGPGEGWWEHELDGGFGFAFGWRDDAFRLELSAPSTDASPDRTPADDRAAPRVDADQLADTFDAPVVPEATPNPRTIRFVTGPIHSGPSRWYQSADSVDDARVAQLFRDFDDVDNVLVGPNFVAVGLRRPDRWESLLIDVLNVVTAQFLPTGAAQPPPARGATEPTAASSPTRRRPPPSTGSATGTSTGMARAWRQLAALRPDQPHDLEVIVAASSSPNGADRQVAARVLVDAEADTAQSVWDRLLADPSRSVRRATVDAIVDSRRPALRPLLERAVSDPDAWIRWKALRGLTDLGIEPSRRAVAELAADTDFRVRLEHARAITKESGG
jgi:hypothetical protein